MLRAVVIAASEYDKNVFMGSLMHRLGLGMPLMERLQQAGIRQYANIVPFMRKEDIDRTFDLPHSAFGSIPAPAMLRAFVIAGSEYDKNVFMGALMHRLGLEMPLMARLQQAEIGQCANNIVASMRREDIGRTLDLPHNSCSLVDKKEDADIIFNLPHDFRSLVDKIENADVIFDLPHDSCSLVDKKEDANVIFNLPHDSCSLVDEIEDADVMIVVLDAAATGRSSLSFLQTEQATLASLRSSNTIVLLDNMESVQWDQRKYADIVQDLREALNDRSDSKHSLRFVPISSAHGDNFVESSERSMWHALDSLTTKTVMEAIVSAGAAIPRKSV